MFFKGCVCSMGCQKSHRIESAAKKAQRAITFPADERLHGADSQLVFKIAGCTEGGTARRRDAVLKRMKRCPRTGRERREKKTFRRGCLRTYQHVGVFHGHANRKKRPAGLARFDSPLPACSPPPSSASLMADSDSHAL